MKKLRNRILPLAAALLACSCLSTRSAVSTDPSYMASREYQQRHAADGSLITADKELLEGESVAALLDSRIVLPEQARLAVATTNYDESLGIWSASDDGQGSLFDAFSRARRVNHVSLLPSLLTPSIKSVPHLRVAAARYQAHLLLVYKGYETSFTEWRVFRRDRARTQYAVEAVLLDVRTGTVPFTSVSYQEYEVQESKQDFSLYEAERRAQQAAERAALRDIAEDLTAFLDAIP